MLLVCCSKRSKINLKKCFMKNPRKSNVKATQFQFSIKIGITVDSHIPLGYLGHASLERQFSDGVFGARERQFFERASEPRPGALGSPRIW